jgi:sporulation protein YlmC with PRC-barrel domain
MQRITNQNYTKVGQGQDIKYKANLHDKAIININKRDIEGTIIEITFRYCTISNPLEGDVAVPWIHVKEIIKD